MSTAAYPDPCCPNCGKSYRMCGGCLRPEFKLVASRRRTGWQHTNDYILVSMKGKHRGL